MTEVLDLITVYGGEGLVFLNETKSTATKEYITRFADFIEGEHFFTFFPQYLGMTLVPVFSSIYLGYVELLTEKNIFAVRIEGSILHLRNGETLREKCGL